MNRDAFSRPLEILLVDDDREDAEMTIETFRAASVPCRVSWVCDGVEGLQFLRREEPYLDAPSVDLVVLDVQMPRMDGREMLAELRADENLRHLTVVVMTGSLIHRAILESESFRADGFFIKPVDVGQFVPLVRRLRFHR